MDWHRLYEQAEVVMQVSRKSEWTASADTDFWPHLSDFQATTKVEVSVSQKMKRRVETDEKTGKKIQLFQPTGDAVIFLTYTPIEGKEGEALKFKFARLIDGLPISAFCSCKECGNFYIHLTKNERQFCSNKCAARLRARNLRKAIKKTDPQKYEKYLAKGKDRALKSYDKRTPGVRKGLRKKPLIG